MNMNIMTLEASKAMYGTSRQQCSKKANTHQPSGNKARRYGHSSQFGCMQH